MTAFQSVKRLHDLNRPGTHHRLLWLPFYKPLPALQLLLKRGTDRANDYGEDPLAVTRLGVSAC